MAYDNVIFSGTIPNATAAGTDTILTPIFGAGANIRTGYGNARLVAVEAYATGAQAGNIKVRVKNSNQVLPMGLWAVKVGAINALQKNMGSYMSGLSCPLAINSTMNISVRNDATATAAVTVHVCLTIDYDAVPAVDPNVVGFPVVLDYSKSGVVAAANTVVSIGTYDNLLVARRYILREAVVTGMPTTGINWLIIQGFAAQSGLVRAIPIPTVKPVEGVELRQIRGSIMITKQQYDLAVLSSAAITTTTIGASIEMWTDSN